MMGGPLIFCNPVPTGLCCMYVVPSFELLPPALLHKYVPIEIFYSMGAGEDKQNIYLQQICTLSLCAYYNKIYVYCARTY